MTAETFSSEAQTGAHNRDSFVIAGALTASAFYATLRYNVFKGVAWSDWPHYVGNKVLALASLILVAVAVRRLVARHPRPIGQLMAVASGLAFAHTLVSLALFEPAYLEKFYSGARLTLPAGASITVGAAAAALLFWGKGRRGASAAASAVVPLSGIAFLSGVHAGLPSPGGWFEPTTWPGGMPPITLISFVIGLAALSLATNFRFRMQRRRGSAIF